MKKTLFISMCSFMLLGGVIFTSCQKEEILPNQNQVEEGLKSSTGNQELEQDTEELEVVFHKSYPGNLSEEEVSTLFAKEYKEFSKNLVQSKANPVYYFNVRTYTSSTSGAGTYGRTFSRFYFQSSSGGTRIASGTLNPSGNYIAPGTWDYYVLTYNQSSSKLGSITLNRAYLYLQGTDQWKPLNYFVFALDENQNYPANGDSRIYTYPGVWLDNSTSTGWDTYDSQPYSGAGTLWFTAQAVGL